MTSRPDSAPFGLVLALWGTKYASTHLNQIVHDACRLSPRLDRIVLVTDRLRDGVDARVRQVTFPAPFDGPAFFAAGYRAKLAVFAPDVAGPGRTWVFLDLDTVVVGDLGQIAGLVRGVDDLFMLPPGGFGFGRLRRLRDWLKGDTTFPVGNSSILAFHGDASPNLAETYARRFAVDDLPDLPGMNIDDVVISWFGQGRVRGVPTGCGVMFRREYLSRVPGWARLKARLPLVQQRRSRIAAVTFNGLAVKPEHLATVAEGDTVSDGRGRSGPWTSRAIGPLRSHLHAIARRQVAANQPADHDRTP